MSAEHKTQVLPGSHLLRIAADYFDQSTSKMILKPIVADLQHEYCDRSSETVARWFVLLRGYLSFWKAIGLYVLTIREANMRILKLTILNLIALIISGLIVYPFLYRPVDPSFWRHYVLTVNSFPFVLHNRVLLFRMPGDLNAGSDLGLLLAGLAGVVIALILGARVVAFLMGAFSISALVYLVYPARMLTLPLFWWAVPLAALLGVVLGAIMAMYGSKCCLRLFRRKHTELANNT